MTVVYCATRNLYPVLPTAINSLLTNNPNVNVICILEDDECEYIHNDRVRIINANTLKGYLWRYSANYNTVFTYMSLMRICFAKYFPEHEKLLYLDVDTIVDENIENLWDIETDKALIAVQDACMPKGYFNSGVLFMNLHKYLQYDDECLSRINSKKRYLFCDQDVLNEVCGNDVLLIGNEYNTFCNKQSSEKPKIIHYAGFREWWNGKAPNGKYYEKYKCESI